jgi:hypothetical protein
VFSLRKGAYWSSENSEIEELTTLNPEQAFAFNIRNVRAMVLNRDLFEIRLFDDVAANGRKCLIEQVLPKTVIKLLELAPANEIARAHALSRLTVPIPNECQTFEQIKEWIEKEVEPSRARLVYEQYIEPPQTPVNPAQLMQIDVAPPPAVNRHDDGRGFNIDVERSETEHGTCNYSVRCHGETTAHVTTDMIRNAVSRAIDEGMSIRRAVNELEGIIIDEIEVETFPDEDDYDYHNHNATDATDNTTEINHDALRDRLLNYLRNHDPEALAVLQRNRE